jgi:hypothetical protein
VGSLITFAKVETKSIGFEIIAYLVPSERTPPLQMGGNVLIPNKRFLLLLHAQIGKMPIIKKN